MEKHEMNPTQVCSICGAVLGYGQAFCAKCGTPQNVAKKNVCYRCGIEFGNGKFCPNCGQKAGRMLDENVNGAFSQFHAGMDTTMKAKKNPLNILIVAVVVVAVVAVVAIAAFVGSEIFASVEDLCAEGNYEEAYEKAADSDEKLAVRVENIAAVQSADVVDALKDSGSFELRNAYYIDLTDDGGAEGLVLHVNGVNDYGVSVGTYFLYTCGEEQKWQFIDALSSLSEDYDDSSYEEKLRLAIKSVMNDGHQLSRAAVKRINALFEADELDNVELLEFE